MASPELLVPDEDDSGWPTGTFEDINETIASADGSVMSTTDAAIPDVLILDFGDSEVVDADTVTNITINMRARVLGSGGKDDLQVELLIGGSPVGSAVIIKGVGSAYSTLVFNDSGWNADRSAADMDGIQIRVTSQQRGMPSTATYEIDAVDLVATFTTSGSAAQVAGQLGPIKISNLDTLIISDDGDTLKVEGKF